MDAYTDEVSSTPETTNLNTMKAQILTDMKAEKIIYSPFSGDIWTVEQWNEYLKWEESRQENSCGSECYGCEKCESIG